MIRIDIKVNPESNKLSGFTFICLLLLLLFMQVAIVQRPCVI